MSVSEKEVNKEESLSIPLLSNSTSGMDILDAPLDLRQCALGDSCPLPPRRSTLPTTENLINRTL